MKPLPVNDWLNYSIGPLANLEPFKTQNSIVEGISPVGEVGSIGESVHVAAWERRIANSADSPTTKGLRIIFHVVTDGLSKRSSSDIDLEDIDSLIKGIEGVAKVDTTVTKLSGFTATYMSRGGLVFTVFGDKSDPGKRVARIWNQHSVIAMQLTGLEEFARLLATAKSML